LTDSNKNSSSDATISRLYHLRRMPSKTANNYLHFLRHFNMARMKSVHITKLL